MTASEPAMKKWPTENDIPSFSGFKSKLSPDSLWAQMIAGRIVSLIIRGMHSYSMVHEPRFCSFLGCVAPEYNPLVRTTFSRFIVPKMHEETKQCLQGELLAIFKRSSCCCSITVDNGTLHAGDSCISRTSRTYFTHFSCAGQRVHATRLRYCLPKDQARAFSWKPEDPTRRQCRSVVYPDGTIQARCYRGHGWSRSSRLSHQLDRYRLLHAQVLALRA